MQGALNVASSGWFAADFWLERGTDAAATGPVVSTYYDESNG